MVDFVKPYLYLVLCYCGYFVPIEGELVRVSCCESQSFFFGSQCHGFVFVCGLDTCSGLVHLLIPFEPTVQDPTVN